MTIIPLTLPKWGMSMSEGTLVAILAAPGDVIAAGQEIYEIETSKIANSVEAPAGGILHRWVAEPGQVLAVGALVGIIADKTVDDAEIDAFIASFVIEPTEDETAVEEQKLHILDVSGRPIQYQKISTPGSEAGIPLVLVHGFGGNIDNWVLNVTPLSADRPVYVLDLPGHGGSTKDVDNATLGALAETILDFLRALDLDKVHLAGHSLGGAIALSAALADPARIISLSLIAPACFGFHVNDEYISGFIKATRYRELKPIVEMLFNDSDLVTRDLVEDLLKAKRIDGATEALLKLATNLFPVGIPPVNYKDRLPELTMPIMVLWGANDKIIPVTEALELPSSVQVEVLDNCGHMPQIEAAKRVNNMLAAHLAAATL